MTRSSVPARRRILALSLALLLALGSAAPVWAADIAPACDETCYATLDAYGGLLESSEIGRAHV